MFNLFKKNKLSDMNIVYKNKDVKSKIIYWCKLLNIDSFRWILNDLGIDKDRIVYLYEDSDNLDRVLYSIDEDRVDYDNWIMYDDKNKEITINNRDGYKNYRINYLDSMCNNYNLELYSKKRVVNDRVNCFHKYGIYDSLFVIDNGDYELTLEIGLNMDNGCFLCEIEDINSRELEDYLINLEFPIVIEDVYKDICKIVNMDESMFKIFDLVVTKNVDKKKVDMVMDQILVCGGELVRIIKCYDKGIITLNGDGSFSYDKFDCESVFSLRYNNNSRYRYRFSDDDSNKYRDFDMIDLVLIKDDANIYVENTKKLVRDMFKI